MSDDAANQRAAERAARQYYDSRQFPLLSRSARNKVRHGIPSQL